jgi:ankyrin repeat protein
MNRINESFLQYLIEKIKSPYFFSSLREQNEVKEIVKNSPFLLNVRDSNSGVFNTGHKTPLMFVIENQNEGLITFFLSKDELNLSIQDSNGDTALVYAIRTNNPFIVKQIIDKIRYNMFRSIEKNLSELQLKKTELMVNSFSLTREKKEDNDELNTLLENLNITQMDKLTNKMMALESKRPSSPTYFPRSPIGEDLDDISLENRLDISITSLKTFKQTLSEGRWPPYNSVLNIKNNKGLTPLDIAKLKENKEIIYTLMNPSPGYLPKKAKEDDLTTIKRKEEVKKLKERIRKHESMKSRWIANGKEDKYVSELQNLKRNLKQAENKLSPSYEKKEAKMSAIRSRRIEKNEYDAEDEEDFGEKRINGLKCMNKLKKLYPKYYFGLGNGRVHYKPTKLSRWRSTSPKMKKQCNIKSKSKKRRSVRVKSKSKKRRSLRRKSKSKKRRSVRVKSKSKKRRSLRRKSKSKKRRSVRRKSKSKKRRSVK